jgi:hypothetical protein
MRIKLPAREFIENMNSPKSLVGRTFRSDKKSGLKTGLQALTLQGLKPNLLPSLMSELKLRPTNPTTDTSCKCFSHAPLADCRRITQR